MSAPPHAPGAASLAGTTQARGGAPSGRRRGARDGGPPGWWTPRRSFREVMLALAATPGPLPAVVAGRLAGGRDPAELLRPDSPEPGLVAGRLDGLGLRFVLPADPGWPFAGAPPEPPCAWLFVAGPLPPPPDAAVAVVGGRRASPLRLAVARSLGAGLAGAGRCVVSGGAVGVDTAAHAGALDGGGRTVAVVGCGLDVPYPRANAALFRRILAEGGTLLGEHPPCTRPVPANFIPRNRLIAASLGEFGSDVDWWSSLRWSDGTGRTGHCAPQVSRTGQPS
jgi:DNA protecting protein DprA